MEDTEDGKIMRAPIVVTLGGKEYDIKPLVIKEAREWREKLANMISKLPQYTKVTTDDAEGFGNAINAIMVSMPNEMAGLFFAYAKDLDRETIETTATELELAKGIEAVMEIALPLIGSMTGAMKKLA